MYTDRKKQVNLGKGKKRVNLECFRGWTVASGDKGDTIPCLATITICNGAHTHKRRDIHSTHPQMNKHIHTNAQMHCDLQGVPKEVTNRIRKKSFESFCFLPGDMKQRIVLKFEEIQSIQGNNTFFSYPLATSQMIKANLWLTLLVTFFWDNLYYVHMCTCLVHLTAGE